MLKEVHGFNPINLSDYIRTPDINIGYYTAEEAIERLFTIYRNNTCFESVATKVAIVNQFYSAGLYITNNKKTPSIIEMSKRICLEGNRIDTLEENDTNTALAIFKSISNSYDSKKNNAPSFTSKYLSFALRARGIDIYPITDSNSRKTLSLLLKRQSTAHQLENYTESFYTEMKKLRESLDNSVSYKELDAFLWIIGKVIA